MKSENEFYSQVTMESVTQVIPEEVIQEVIADCEAEEERRRKLPTYLVILLCIAMSLWSQESIGYGLMKVLQGVRFLTGLRVEHLPDKSAISRARYRVGVKPLERLFKQVCRPIATTDTQGAFAFGLRLVAIDGTIERAADSPANAAWFGRSVGGRGQSAFPLMQVVYLCECATHVIFDAGLWPYITSERQGGYRMLRSVTDDMLVMWDRGFHAYEMVAGVIAQGGHLLSRLPAHVKPRFVARLDDGTWVGELRSSSNPVLPPIRVRVIEYEVTDPEREGFGVRHRLITTLLDPDIYPAMQLATLYHKRWEIEVTIDELDTHQRLADRPFRSQKPVGVIQEFYGLVLAHFVVRSIMHEAAVDNDLDPRRLSFINALRLVRDAVFESQIIHPAHFDLLWHRLLDDVASFVLPERENRSNPRVVKRKMSNFKVKRPDHHHGIRFRKPFARSLRLNERALGSAA